MGVGKHLIRRHVVAGFGLTRRHVVAGFGLTRRHVAAGKRSTRGQMTVELAVGIPVFIAIALVVCNACLFLENCAAFDRLAKDAVRVYATAPGYGQSTADSAVLIQSSLQNSFSADYLDVSVEATGAAWGFTQYSATLYFTPTLFGRPFSGAVYSVVLGPLQHTTQLTVDPYKPGAVL